MRNIFLFFFLTFLTGSPIIALLVILAVYLFLDYQFVGFSSRWFAGFHRQTQIRSFKRDLAINPHDASARSHLGRLLVEARRHPQAVGHLEQSLERMPESEDVMHDLGLAYLWTGKVEEGEALIRSVLEREPKFRYGEPYLRWGEFLLSRGRIKEAAEVLEKFGEIHTSSVEGSYLLGEAYRRQGKVGSARASYLRGLEAFKRSPRYKRRAERLWVWKTRFRLLFL